MTDTEPQMSRANHLAWAKQRALWELEPGGGGVATAISSIVQDFATHPDLADHPARTMMTLLALSGNLSTTQQAREFIEGIG
jgi:hypothetical protein